MPSTVDSGLLQSTQQPQKQDTFKRFRSLMKTTNYFLLNIIQLTLRGCYSLGCEMLDLLRKCDFSVFVGFEQLWKMCNWKEDIVSFFCLVCCE